MSTDTKDTKRQVVTITENLLSTRGTTSILVCKATTETGESLDVEILLSEQRPDLAVKGLEACGFIVGKDNLDALLGDSQFLAGNQVEIEANDFVSPKNGKTYRSWRPVINGAPAPEKLAQLNSILIHAKGELDGTGKLFG